MAKTRSVLAQKRVSGPSANAQMIVHMRTAHCHYCDAEPVTVKNIGDGKTKKLCMEHILGKNPQEDAIQRVMIRVEGKPYKWSFSQ